MNIVSSITIDEMRGHEVATNANVRLGGYAMDELFPVDEILMYRVTFETGDLARLFVLWDLSRATLERSCQLADTLPAEGLVLAMERIPDNSVNEINLAISTGREPVLVTNNLHSGALTVIDGNHRILAHFIRHQSINGVSALVAQHANMHTWPYVPRSAREYAG